MLPRVALAVFLLFPFTALRAQNAEATEGTFSIVARDPESGELGGAVQSKAFATGSRTLTLKGGVAAVAHQSAANPLYGVLGIELLRAGMSPQQALDQLLRGDEGRESRQVGMIDAQGRVAAWTGKEPREWKGHRSGSNFCVQGNILAGPEVLEAMAHSFETSTGPLAERLLGALDAAQAAGGDARGMQAAALVVVKPLAGAGGFGDRVVDLRVDDHRAPLTELRRLLNMLRSREWIADAEKTLGAGDLKTAAELATQARDKSPEYDEAWIAVAATSLRLHRKSEALAALGRAIDLNPANQRQLLKDSRFTSLLADAPFKQATASTVQNPASPTAKLFADYYEQRLKLFPREATYAGDDRYNAELPNELTDEVRSRQKAFFQKYLESVRGLDRETLSSEEQLSCDILQWECERQLEQLDFPMHLLPINQFNSLHVEISQWAGGTSAQPFNTVRDYDNWLKRLDAFTQWCHTAMSNMRLGIKRGYVLPRAITEKVIPQIAALTKLPVEEHLYYAPIKQMPAVFSDVDRARLATAYSSIIEQKIIPAFRHLEEFLRTEYLAASRASSGLSGIPCGDEYYRAMIKNYTTTDLTADEIHQLGLREVARLTAEMNKVREQVGFQGDLKAFFGHVRNRKDLMPFTEPQQVIEHFQALRRKVQPSVERLFSLTPKTALEIRRTEAFREASSAAEWNYGSLDGTRPGIFKLPIPNVRSYNILRDEAVFLHEAIPGHHFQFSLQRENDRLPLFRRVIDYAAFGEGWGLYSEALGKELGFYTDPYQYLGMLSMEMHRAIRLVVDTGLHAKGWTREQAIQYSLDNEAATEDFIVPEIERYMVYPGQALSYKIGQLKILELRERSEKALGNRFDIRVFHARVLESGCMPLKLLEQKIDRWLATETKK